MLAPGVQWPPNYLEVVNKRALMLLALKTTPGFLRGAKHHYANSGAQGCIDFIEDWCDTFDPRNAGTDKPTRMPFILFQRQREFIEFLHACYTSEANGLIEKSRDMGATWLCCAFSVWCFLFVPGSDIGWGSRKALSVDQIGNLNSIFEKMRYILRSVPIEFWPAGFGEDSMSYMRIQTKGGNSIVGESGDDIGRGGRTKATFKDESAHYEHPEMIEASLGDNTRVQIDISSVNGLGNVFHRKRESGVEWCGGEVVRGKTNVFVMDWRDHPAKSQEWYDERFSKAMDEGLLHKFYQEIDRNYSASVEGVIIPADWVRSAIDAHVKLDLDTGLGWHAGLDVADEGGDRNALVTRRGILVCSVDEWGAPDVGDTTRRCIGMLTDLVPQNSKRRHPCRVYYDSVGVGAGVKAEVNRLEGEDQMPPGIKFYSWNAGAKVQLPEEKVYDDIDGEIPTNDEFFQNLKAQAWWSVRRRFEVTHRAVNEKNFTYNVDDLISLPSTLPKLRQLEKELSQPTTKKSIRMKLMVDKKPEGTRSPNLADALVMCFFPVEAINYDSSMDWL